MLRIKPVNMILDRCSVSEDCVTDRVLEPPENRKNERVPEIDIN